jgi:hypothetical protein
MSWMERRIANAIVAAEGSLRAGRLRVAYARMPHVVQDPGARRSQVRRARRDRR